jgi:hypothetical protein
MRGCLSFIFALALGIFTCASALADDLQTATADYNDSANALMGDLKYLKLHAGECGIIGRRMSKRMDRAMSDLSDQIEQVRLLEAKDKRKSVARRLLEDSQAKNRQMEENLKVVRFGLSSSNCGQTREAFEDMRTRSLQFPKKLNAILEAIDRRPASEGP